MSVKKYLYKPEIEGLKAFAVIAVIINHFNKDILPSGFLGVDIFFVISGYLITSSLSATKNKKFLEFIFNFYIKRFKRLFPLLSVFVLIISFFICLFDPNPQFSLRTGISSLFGISNIYLFKQATEYFAQSTNLNVFTHTWSLGVEIQFYLLFPFVFWFSGFRKNNNFRRLSTILLFLLIFSLIAFIYIYPINQSAAYFLMPTRIWEIASGSLLFIFIQSKGLFFKSMRKLPPSLIIVATISVMFMPISFAALSTILIVIFTALLITCLKKGTLFFKFFTNKQVVDIGSISYSLYLWHWGIISLSRWTIGLHWWSIPIQIVLIYVLSNLSYKIIEKPLRTEKWLIYDYKSISQIFLVVLVSTLTLLSLDNPLKSLYLGRSREETNKNWRKNIESVSNEITGKKCHGNESYSQEELKNLFQGCNIIKNRKNKTIVFVGDSHILPLISAHKIIYNKGYNILHYSFSGCPFPSPTYGIFPKKCNKFHEESKNKILSTLKKGDFVVIGNYNISHLGDNSLKDVRHNIYNKNKKRIHNSEKKFNIFTNSLINFSNEVNSKGINVIFIGAGLRNNFFEISHKEWFRPFPPNIIYREEYKNALRLNNKFSNRFSNINNLVFLNPLKEIECCKNNEDYHIYYRDSDHLSDFGAKKYMQRIYYLISST